MALKTTDSTVKLDNFSLLGGKLTGSTTIGVQSIQSKENKDNVIPWGEIPGRLQRILKDRVV